MNLQREIFSYQVLDDPARLAAFEHIRKLSEVFDCLTYQQLAAGFKFGGQRIPIMNRQRGIFKPQAMRYVLSIKTVVPSPGRKAWYEDQHTAHKQIYDGEGSVDYAFMGDNPDAAANRQLREAMEKQIPVIYFLGIKPGRYKAILPTFITGWDSNSLSAKLSFGVPGQVELTIPETSEQRRYTNSLVKQRLHQTTFRAAVLDAYGGRCALSGLPEQKLLDAAHIIADSNEQFGQPTVPNGLPLSKIHHAAFDAHLIGIDPDYRVHVSERLVEQNDGPMLEALKQLEGKAIRLPRRNQDLPDRERLELRYTEFRNLA